MLDHAPSHSDPPRPRATYQDVLDAPAHKVAEIIDGVLHLNPRPAPLHGVARSVLGARINRPFQLGEDGPGGWWIIDEPELHFGEDVVVPDVAGWKKSRMPELPDTAYFTLAPDWVCEVLSPSTKKLDRGRKSAIYIRNRVKHMWLVDPIERTLEVYALTNDRWQQISALRDSAVVCMPPFEAISFDLADLWGNFEPPAKTLSQKLEKPHRMAHSNVE